MSTSPSFGSPPPKVLDEGISPVPPSPSASPLWLPEAQQDAWRAILRGPAEGAPLIALHYGDSHTQGAFLTRALRDELSAPSAPRSLAEPSPGFVHQGHPHSWGGEVALSGHWIRQNWIYRGDQGPFGPLGISFVTQDRRAEVSLTLDNPPAVQHAQVTLFYVDEPGRLGFCVRALPDPEQVERAERRQAKLTEAPRRYEAHFHPSTELERSVHSELEADLSRGADSEGEGSSQLEGEQRSGEQGGLEGSNVPPADQRSSLQELLSERGRCVSPAHTDEQERQTTSLKTLTLSLPPRHLLRLTTQGGLSIKDQDIKRWRRARERARKRRRGKRAQAKSAPRPDLIKPNEGRLRVLGFHVRYPDASIEWSALGVRGARVHSPAQRHAGSIDTLVTVAQPNLFVLWFGTNSAASESINLTRYERDYRSLIHSLKTSAPQAMCLMITAPDFGRRDRTCYLNSRERRALKRRRRTAWARQTLAEHRSARVCDPDSLLNMRKRGRHRYPVPEVRTQRQWEAYQARCQFQTPTLVAELTELQKRVAHEEGCAVYDTLSAMGGEGSIQRWACAEPSWAQLDLVHLSVAGYEALGAHIARTLRYELGLSERPPPPLSPPLPPAVKED